MSVEAPAQDQPRTRSAAAASRTLRTVAPVDSPPEPEAAAERPPALHAVSVTVNHGRCSVSVEIRAGSEQAMGVAEGACAGGGMDRLVADATVRAVAAVDRSAARVAVEAVVVAPVGSRMVATVAMAQPLGAGEEPLAGAAPVGPAGTADAVARAVLDALSARSTPR
jgi:hypothetical protein